MSYDIGILGGGQLARMSIHAAQRMGLTCISLDPSSNSPASQVAASHIGALSDPHAIAAIAEQSEFLALENEFIPVEAIREGLRIANRPDSILLLPLDSLKLIQDKLAQREAYEKAGVPSPRAVALEVWLQDRSLLPLPAVLKARFGGYDGKGTRLARTEEELEANLEGLGDGTGWLIEEFVPFKRELAVMAYRLPNGTTGAFPTVESRQVDNICDLVLPSSANAREIALKAIEAVGAYGLVGVELFEAENGRISINEMAPRPHNSGHYTMDWGAVSQFEQHVRLTVGLPVDTSPQGLPSVMANLIGKNVPKQPVEQNRLQRALNAALSHSGVHVHWYGKAELRDGRKMGHINCVDRDADVAEIKAVAARNDFWEAFL